MALDLSKIHIDTFLTNISVAYSNDEYVASKVFPETPVEKKSDKYAIYSKDRFRQKDDLRSPGAEANEVHWDVSPDTYYAEGHALKVAIPDEWDSNEDVPIDVEMDGVMNVTETIDLNREINLVSLLDSGMTGTSVQDLNSLGKQFDSNGLDPVAYIDAQKEVVMKSVFKRPNCLLLSRPVFRGMRNNPNIVQRVTGAPQLAPNSMITQNQLAELLEVDEIIIADAVKLTSHEGQTDASDFIWGKRALLFYRPPSPGLRQVSLGYHFMWDVIRAKTISASAPKGISASQALGTDGAAAGRIVKRYRIEPRSADIIECHEYYDQKIVAAGAGILFQNAVA